MLALTLPGLAPAADLLRGRDLYVQCAPCHGPRGEGSTDGKVPRIAGQPPRFLDAQLRAFRAGSPRGALMMPWLSELAETDLEDVVAWLAQNPIPTRGPNAVPVPLTEGDLVAGRKLFKKRCGVCHGPEGRGRGEYPALVGQHPNYLQRQVLTISAGERQHGDDDKGPLILKDLGLDQMQAVLAWLGSQQSVTPSKPNDTEVR